MEASRKNCLLVVFFSLALVASFAEGLSGPNVCTRWKSCYKRVRTCRYRFWGICTSYMLITQGYSCTIQFCCTGWKTNGNQRCDIPVTTPPPDNATTAATTAVNNNNNSTA